ncbi:MAG: DUF1925 domain-containing protein [Treponema sp.]|nr:DUF1925 domain-containing protein [Treponema sp.]
MSGKISLILGVHNHLPNGTGEEEFEALYNSRIRPLVSALYQFPRINVMFHYSGVLLYWIERRHPELFVLIEDLLSRKQAELLGGGFYEPMMPLLPVADRIGQIEMLTTYLRRQFGKRPSGCLIPSQGWEQGLVVPLNACGMNYTFLDESWFAAAGGRKCRNFHQPCITEDQGKIITVFPVSSSLENDEPAVLLEKLLACRNTNEGPVIIFPAFNLKPGEAAETGYQHFFEELSGADSDIEFTTTGRLFRNLINPEKLYFTVYPAVRPSPRRFLTEYPEADGIYAKMIQTRVFISQLRGDKSRKQSALEELWKAQDSAIYSPAGISNPAVRKAAYRALLEAEKIAREKDPFTPTLSVFDYDLDGRDEYIILDEKINCSIKSQGAGLLELDYIPRTWNFLDIFAGCRENNAAEAVRAAAQSGAAQSAAGQARRLSFTEYLAPGKTLPAIGWQGINGSCFCGDKFFETAELERIHRQITFSLGPEKDRPCGNIGIKKTWLLKRNVLTLQYSLTNTGTETEDFFLVPSVDFSFSGCLDSYLKIFTVRESARENLNPAGNSSAAGNSCTAENSFSAENLNSLEFRDLKNETVVLLDCSRRFSAGIFHAVIDDVYQFTCVMPVLPVALEGGKTWDTVFSLKISS